MQEVIKRKRAKESLLQMSHSLTYWAAELLHPWVAHTSFDSNRQQEDGQRLQAGIYFPLPTHDENQVSDQMGSVSSILGEAHSPTTPWICVSIVFPSLPCHAFFIS